LLVAIAQKRLRFYVKNPQSSAFMLRFLFACILSFATALASAQPSGSVPRVWFVDAASAAANPDGSRTTPFTSLQHALTRTQDGDTVHVAAGSYEGPFTLPDRHGLVLRGGYASGNFSERDPATHPTRLQGVASAPVLELMYQGGSGQRQVYVIEGFVIERGIRGVFALNLGNGGLAELHIRDNTIRHNAGLTGSNDYGGGVSSRGMILTLQRNHIHDNACGKSGGFALQLNSSEHAFLIEDNLVENNRIHSDHGAGAGIQAYRGIVRNNVFRNNHILNPWGWGGGLIVDGNRYTGFNDDVYISLIGNQYLHNRAPSGGAGLFIDEGANVRMSHELIAHNSAPQSSRNGPLLIDGPRGTPLARTEAQHLTIAANLGDAWSFGHALYIDADAEARVSNSIFWGNGPGAAGRDIYVDATGRLELSWTLLHGGATSDGVYTESNVFSANPLFADAASGNFHVRSQGGRYDPVAQEWVVDEDHSPAIDAADPTAPYDLEPMPHGGRANLGVWGNTHLASRSRPTTSRSPDHVLPVPSYGPYLYPPYPNPSSAAVTLRGTLGSDSPYSFTVWDALGRRMPATSTHVRDGHHFSATLDRGSLPSGVYLVVLEANAQRSTRLLHFLP